MTPLVERSILEAQACAPWRSATVTSVESARRFGPRVELVELARHGDAAAFDRLLSDRVDDAYRLALAILRSEPDARDAVQEAFLGAWRQVRGLRDPAKFDAWLDRIVVNACRMALRHRRTVRVHEIDTGASPAALELDPRRSTPAGEDAEAEADLVRRAFVRLTADERSILVLHHVQDRPVDEIAAVLGIPIGTVKWRLHAARNALRRAVEEESR